MRGSYVIARCCWPLRSVPWALPPPLVNTPTLGTSHLFFARSGTHQASTVGSTHITLQSSHP